MRPEEQIREYMTYLKNTETPGIYWSQDRTVTEYTAGRLRGRIEALEWMLIFPFGDLHKYELDLHGDQGMTDRYTKLNFDER
jgi:hypothetical protein